MASVAIAVAVPLPLLGDTVQSQTGDLKAFLADNDAGLFPLQIPEDKGSSGLQEISESVVGSVGDEVIADGESRTLLWGPLPGGRKSHRYYLHKGPLMHVSPYFMRPIWGR